jgi:hypothetical protein
MRNSVCCTIVGAALITIAGCATGPGLQGSRYAPLPTGVTLLGKDSAHCAGAVQVREEQAGRTSDHELVLHPGEFATFTVHVAEGDELEWSCIGDTRSESTRIDCPDATSHVRIARRAEGEGSELTLECYGHRYGRS